MNADTLLGFIDRPLVVFIGSVVLQVLATVAGYLLRSKKTLDEEGRNQLDTAHTAALGLLALVIGFSFSLAAGRYDQRKNYEEAEANAIGTEYVRMSLLPPAQAEQGRQLLKVYLQERIQFYTVRDHNKLGRIAADTTDLQNRMWSLVVTAQPSPFTALAVAGMNDVINSEGYTHAAWLYHVPEGAWVFMEAMAAICNALFGYRFRGSGRVILIILPVVSVLSFFVISDIDNPRRGVIEVVPQNLILTLQSMK